MKQGGPTCTRTLASASGDTAHSVSPWRARPLATQRQRDPRIEIGAEAPRRHVTLHRVRRRMIGIGDDLRAARHLRAIERGESRPVASDPAATSAARPEQRLADAPLRRVDELAHAEIVGGRAAIGLGTDDDVALFDAQRAHRLGAVGHDAERRRRRRCTASHIATTAVGGHVDLVGELAGIAHPEQPRRNDRRSPARTWHAPTARNGNAAFDTSMSTSVASTSRAFGPDSAAADHCSVTDVAYTSSSRPFRLQQVLEVLHHLDRVHGGRRHQVVRRRRAATSCRRPSPCRRRAASRRSGSGRPPACPSG